MSHGVQAITVDDVPTIAGARFRRMSQNGKFVFGFLIGMAAVLLFAGAISADPSATWVIFHANTMFWLCLSAASAGFSAVFHICNAEWPRSIRRLFEAGSAYLPYAWIPLAITYLFGGEHLFEWYHHRIPGKGIWLTPNFVFARDILGLILFGWLARRVVQLSVERDIGVLRSGAVKLSEETAKRWEGAAYANIADGWKGDYRAGVQRATERMTFLSPLVVIAYACIMSLVVFDQIMSIDPEWFSTLFGVFVFMSGVYLAVAWCALSIIFVRGLSPLLRKAISRKTLWDLGKLMFGFGIFWCYLFWSHYLTIWYGNLPEETKWLILRLRQEPWHSFAWTVLGMCFIFPFLFGLSRDVKQVPEILSFAAGVVTIGLWMSFFLLIAPTIFPQFIPLSLGAVLITLGFGAVYVFLSRRFLERFPLIPFGDLFR